LATVAAPVAGGCYGAGAGEALRAEPPPDAYAAEIPFVREEWLLVDVDVAGARGKFIVDTGSGVTVVDPSLVAGLGLEGAGVVRVRDFEGRRKAHDVLVAPELEIGGLVYRDVGLVAVDLSLFSDLACVPVAGILGQNVLAQGVFELDPAAGVIRLASTAAGLEARPGGIAIPLVPPAVAAGVASPVRTLIPRPFTLDTGSSGSITVDRRTLRGLEIRRAATVRGLTRSGLGGISEGRVTYFTWPERPLAGLEVAGVPAAGGVGSNTIGLGVLMAYVLRLDARAARAELWPLRELGRVSAGFGLGLHFDGDAVIVASLVDGGPAAAAGVRVGDRLARIGERVVDAMTTSDRCRVARDFGGGAAVELELVGERGPYTVSLRRAEVLD
ncbi:MAG: aspartyl protease family protein, partial [Myxococcales bacterium]|nr:aspartyl protease family protein [Myxococcales bacterium]